MSKLVNSAPLPAEGLVPSTAADRGGKRRTCSTEVHNTHVKTLDLAMLERQKGIKDLKNFQLTLSNKFQILQKDDNLLIWNNMSDETLLARLSSDTAAHLQSTPASIVSNSTDANPVAIRGTKKSRPRKIYVSALVSVHRGTRLAVLTQSSKDDTST